MDANGYPEEQELETIRRWDLTKQSALGLIDYVIERWWMAKQQVVNESTSRQIKLELHTGGWSGNEELILALNDNLLFWSIYWQKSERGGHYYFEHDIPR